VCYLHKLTSILVRLKPRIFSCLLLTCHSILVAKNTVSFGIVVLGSMNGLHLNFMEIELILLSLSVLLFFNPMSCTVI
jgi:hypothetical protein